MTGRLVQGFCTAAAAAVAAGSLVAGGPAAAQPGPPAPPAPAPAAGSTGSVSGSPGAAAPPAALSPAPPPGAPDATGSTGATGTNGPTGTHGSAGAAGPRATTGSAGPTGSAGSAAAAPAAEPSVTALLTRLQRLYGQAEQAKAAYRAAQKKLAKRRAALGGLDGRLGEARRELHASRVAAGRLARLQYQGGAELSPYVKLLLADDPQHALEQGHLLQRVSAGRAATVRRLVSDEQRAHRLAATADRLLNAQEALAERRRKQRDAVRARLDAVERQLAALGGGPGARRGSGRRAPQPARGARGRPQTLLARALSGPRPPSKGGSEALRYAMAQVGKPYRWGASGPDAFDCSGLTSQAWAHAGRSIPRTSQAQWQRLTHVPMDQLRPGDLVVYYPGATHVALYAGGGMVVQAPRPGAKVKLSPVGTNPVRGAVRPDPREPALNGDST